MAPAQRTPPTPLSHQLFSASTDATQPLPEAAPSVSTSSSGDARRQLSIADGKRLLEQYRRLKAQALAGPRVLAQLEGKCRALEDAMADVVLESDDRREEAEALFAENKALQAQLTELKEALDGAASGGQPKRDGRGERARSAVAAGLPALKAQLARELDLAVRREADVAEAGAAAARLRSERDWLRSGARAVARRRGPQRGEPRGRPQRAPVHGHGRRGAVAAVWKSTSVSGEQATRRWRGGRR